MAWLLTSLLVVILILVAAYWLYNRQRYFKHHNIPYIQSLPFLGSFGDVVLNKIGLFEISVELCNHPAVKDEAFFGIFMFHKPTLVINDVDLIKRILSKDFNAFPNRYAGTDTHDPLGYFGLFSLRNPQWKTFRNKLSPFFGSLKIKPMYHLIDRIGDNLNKHIHEQLSEIEEKKEEAKMKAAKVELELKQLSVLYITDVIASCAFGVQENSFENPQSGFLKAGEAIFARTTRRNLESLSFHMLPQVMKPLRVLTFSKAGTEFIQSTIPRMMKERARSGRKRNDLIDILIEMRKGDKTLTDDMLSAQAAVFHAGGELIVIDDE